MRFYNRLRPQQRSFWEPEFHSFYLKINYYELKLVIMKYYITWIHLVSHIIYHNYDGVILTLLSHRDISHIFISHWCGSHQCKWYAMRCDITWYIYWWNFWNFWNFLFFPKISKTNFPKNSTISKKKSKFTKKNQILHQFKMF